MEILDSIMQVTFHLQIHKTNQNGMIIKTKVVQQWPWHVYQLSLGFVFSLSSFSPSPVSLPIFSGVACLYLCPLVLILKVSCSLVLALCLFLSVCLGVLVFSSGSA
jgi:hypothetical protein